MNCMSIGEAAAAAGVTPKMVRHYESLGLIPEADRTEAGYRLYTPREVAMLGFIRQSRALGFSIHQIDALLALWRDERRQSSAVKDLARRQLADLDARQRELDEMRRTLAGLIENCAGDDGACCAILQRLADPLPVPNQTHATKAGGTLKQVKLGSSMPSSHGRKRSPSTHQRAPVHSGLLAWSRSFASPS
jgi:Cu(I)-responsive transcriptional regulator